MFLFFILSMSQSQVLMLDSRQDQFKSLNLNLFHQQFSIWFTYFMTTDPQYVNLFYIMNLNYSIARFQISPFQIRVLYNQDQIVKIENQQVQNNQWVHLIFNQNENLKKNEFFLKAAQNQTTEYGFQINSTLILDNLSYISIEFSLFQFCLIYDRYSQEIEPIIRQYDLQLLIHRLVMKINVHHSDSSIEFFMKKVSRGQITADMINIYSNNEDIFFISEYDGVFLIQLNGSPIFLESGSRLLRWFRIFIKFEKQNLQLEIQFADKFFQESLKTEIYPIIFYRILLNSYSLNYKFMRFKSYFKVQNYEIFDNQMLLQFQNCGGNIRYYLDIESNSCKDYLELDEIHNIEPDILDDVIQPKFKETFQLQQIGEVVSRSVLSNITNLDLYPLLETYRDEAQNSIKEPFVLWRYQQQVYCSQYYFGFSCNKFIKKCANAIDDHCKKCDDGYLLIRNKCVRCPLNCLFCIFEQNQYKCLIPKIGYFINKNFLAKLCQCQLCNREGECADSQQVISLIEQCIKDEQCFLNSCKEPYSYYSLEKKKCFFLSLNHQNKLRYYLYYQHKNYQYSLSDIQFTLIQNSKIYGNTLMNEMVSDFYLYIQLDDAYQKFYEYYFEFDHEENYYQSRLNLECIKRHINVKGSGTCKEYISIQSKKCNKLPCLYRLIISNIMFYTGAQSYLVYDNQKYISVIELLQSVTSIGIQFYSVCLEITFIPSNTDDGIMEFQDINLHDRSLIPEYSGTLIEFDIKFSQWQNFPLQLKITVDKVIIQNQKIIKLNMSITAVSIEIYNVSLRDHNFCQFDSGGYLIMDKIEAKNNFTIFVEQIDYVVLNDFHITNSSNFRFVFKQINQLTLQNLQLSTQQLNQQTYSYFKIYDVSSTTISKFKMEFKYCFSINFIDALFGQQIYFMDIDIIGQTLFQSQLFILQQYDFASINNYSCQINNIEGSETIFVIKMEKLQIYQLKQISELILESTLFYIYSEFIILHEIKIQSLIEPYSLINVVSSYLTINNLHVIQTIDKNMLVEYSRKGFLIYLQQQMAQISNLHLNGINLIDFGLLFLESFVESKIKNLSITNIKLQYTKESQIVVIKDESSHIQNLLMRKIWIDNQIQAALSIIDMQNKYILISNSSISEIIQVQYITNANIFLFQSLHGELINIKFSQCDNMNQIFSKSKYFQIDKLNSYNNSNSYILKMSEFRLRLFKIINSNISLKKNQFIIYFKTIIESLIILQNIKILYQEGDAYFYFAGYYLTVQMTNIFIDQHSVSRNPDWIFLIYFANLQVRNLTVKNLFQPLFYVLEASSVFIVNVIVTNTEIKQGQFIFHISHGSLKLFNIKFISISQCQGIFDIVSEVQDMVHIHNIYVQNTINVDKIFQIKSNITNELIWFKNIYIWNARDGHIFGLEIEGQQKIMIEDLQIFQANQFVIQQGGYCCFQIKNSIIKIQTINSQNPNLDLKFRSSEIIVNHQLKFQQIQFDRSYIFNNMGSSMVHELKIIATLSLNRLSHLKSIRLDSDQVNCRKFFVTQNGSLNFSFYVPSGSKLSEYKKLNFKSLQPEQIYQGLFLVFQGLNSRNLVQCTQQQIYNDKLLNQWNLVAYAIEEGIYDLNEQVFALSPLNSNYTVFKLNCQSDIDDQTIQLQYNVKAFPCQLGEFLYQNQCLECNTSYNQYSVKQNSNKCNYVDQNKIKSVRQGLLDLNKGYWRYTFTSNIIEYCDQNYCNGGWIPGDKSCMKSRIGALCKECDIYNIRGDGSYTNSNQSCIECESINVKLILKLLFIILWQLFLIINRYYSNQKLSEQYLMFRVGFRQFYLILYRQSIDLPSIIVKIFTNYLFMLFIIRTNFSITGFSFINNINLINNPGLITKAQIDCILSQTFQIDIIYSAYIFQIIQVFFVISLSYTIYLITIMIKKMRFHLGLILYATEGIIVYNLNVILITSFNLLSYQVVSGVKWIKYNLQYLFYTDKHVSMIQFILPLTLIFLTIPFSFPSAIKSLSVFNRQVKRIYAIYYQEYKPQCIFWEYLILYFKYTIMIFQILDDQLIFYGIVIIFVMCLLSQNMKPYYLQNLNMFESNLFQLYGIQLTLLNMSTLKDEVIIILNLLIFTLFAQKVWSSLNSYKLNNIIELKLKIVSKFNWVRVISSLQRNQRQQKNKQTLIYLVKTQILKKQCSQQITTNQITLKTEEEIEMPMISKQNQSKIPPSRK